MGSAWNCSAFTALAVLGIAIFTNYSYIPPLYDVPDVRAHASRGAFLNWNGNAIFYYTTDTAFKKPILLLIHGFPTSSIDFDGIVPALTANFTVVAFDMLGFGLSDKPQSYRYSITEQADIAEYLLQQLLKDEGEYHMLVHDYGASVGQELLARSIRRKSHDKVQAFTPKSAVFLNGGIIPDAHRPFLVQRLLANRFVGPILKRIMVNYFTFSHSLNGVFGPQSKLDSEEMMKHWLLFSHKNGPGIIDGLLSYMQERKAHRREWVHALFDVTIPTAVIIGPEDPISGAHLFDAVNNERKKRLQEHKHHDAAQGDHPYSVLLDPNVQTARQMDLYSLLSAGIGHYPHLEAPQLVLQELSRFYASILAN